MNKNNCTVTSDRILKVIPFMNQFLSKYHPGTRFDYSQKMFNIITNNVRLQVLNDCEDIDLMFVITLFVSNINRELNIPDDLEVLVSEYNNYKQNKT